MNILLQNMLSATGILRMMDDDDDGEQSGHDPEVDEEDNVIVDGGEAVDGEGKVIRREEPGGIIRREEPGWQENEDGKKKEREEKHVSGMRFWLHGNRWMDNYEKARASVRHRKLFNEKMG